MTEKKEKTYPSQLDKVKEITDQLEAGLEKLFDSDAFKQYLTTLSKFHDYSLNNTLLIAMQKPTPVGISITLSPPYRENILSNSSNSIP